MDVFLSKVLEFWQRSAAFLIVHSELSMVETTF